MQSTQEYLDEIFTSLGYGHDEALIYFLLLQNKCLSVADVVRFSNISRSTCYNMLDRLVWDGIAIISDKDGVRTYAPATLGVLQEKVEQKVKKHNDAKEAFDSIAGDLKKYENRGESGNSNVSYFYGEDNMLRLLKSALEEFKDSELLSTCFGQIEKTRGMSFDPDYMQEYFELEAKYNIRERGILEDMIANQEYIKKFGSDNAQFILQPKLKNGNTAHVDKYIFEDKVIFFNFEGCYAIRIEDKFFAENERILFNLMWDRLKK